MPVPPGIPQSSPQAGGLGGQGLMYIQPPPPLLPMVQPPSSVDSHPTPSTQPSSPTISTQGIGGVAKSDGGDGGMYLPPHSQISTLNPLMATSVVPPATVTGPQPPLNPGGPGGGVVSPGQFEQLQGGMPGMGHLPGNPSIFADHPASISANQFPPTHPSLSVNTPLPPPHPSMLAHTPGHTPQGESEPLLPNPPIPPVPLLPMVHQIQPSQPQPPNSTGNGAPFHGQQPDSSPLSSRKEILCRHFVVHGNCPFGEKCWFAHPELQSAGGQPQRPEGAGQGGRISGSPLHVQVPPKFWMNNPMVDYTAMASPPQSPMNPALVPRPPIIPAMFRQRGMLPYANQQPLVFLRGPLPGNPRMPASNLPLMQPSPIPMPLNPILKFGLLSQVMLQGVEGEGEADPTADLTQLSTYADHFFVSYGWNINTYRIIFGGNRNYQVSLMSPSPSSCSLLP